MGAREIAPKPNGAMNVARFFTRWEVSLREVFQRRPCISLFRFVAFGVADILEPNTGGVIARMPEDCAFPLIIVPRHEWKYGGWEIAQDSVARFYSAK